MSKIVTCPTCGAKCKSESSSETGETVYKALQDEDLFKKIEQLKQQVMKKNS